MRFKLGVTFTGTHRSRVNTIVNVLLTLGFAKDDIFYDDWHDVLINGPGADIKLRKIYANDCDCVVVFLSKDYNTRPWTRGVEWEAIREIIIKGKEICLLNVDSVNINEIQGLSSFTTIAKNIETLSDEAVAEFIRKRYDVIVANSIIELQNNAPSNSAEPDKNIIVQPPETEGNSPYNSHRIKFECFARKWSKLPEYKVLLVKTAIKHPISDEDFGVPMGLYVLKDYLKTIGHNLVIDIWDERLELKKRMGEIGNKLEEYKKEDKLFIEYLYNKEYDAVGISMCTSEVIPALKKFKIVKEKYRDTITFCGGIFTTSNEECLLNTNIINYIIPGMATKPLGDLLVRLYHQKYLNEKYSGTKTSLPFIDIDGVVHKDNIKRFNAPWKCSQLPAMQLSMWTEIIEQYKEYLGDRIGIYTTRGCDKKCAFCSVQKESRQTIFRRTDSCVTDEINFLNGEYGFKYFSFKDEDFLDDYNRMKKILGQIQDTNIKFKIRARYDIVSDLIDNWKNNNEDLLKELKDFGIDEIQYGIETYEKGIRRKVDKSFNGIDTQGEIENFIKKHADYGITANCSFILGMDGEDVEYYKELEEFMSNIYRNTSKPKIYLNYLTPHPYNSRFDLRGGIYHLVTDDLNYFTHRYPVCYVGNGDTTLNIKMLETHNKIAEITESTHLNPQLEEGTLKNNFVDCMSDTISNSGLKLMDLLDRDF